MARLLLTGGAYSARSIIANCQRCVNLYPESNPSDAPVPLTHYQRPGLRALANGPVAPVRGLYRASNGNGYTVIGQNVYAVNPSWGLTLLGTLTTYATNPVSFTDNGTTIWLVDGSAYAYQIVLATNAFSQITDAAFTGARKVDVIDTFMICNVNGTNRFLSTLSNQLFPLDPLYFAAKTDYPDPLSTLIVNRHEILLIGELKSEIWYVAGNPQFPFAELPGAFIEHGTCAPYSVASADISTFWVGQDLQGAGFVFRQRGYETKRISTHAIEFAIQQYPTLTDAIGYTYQQGGHLFYVLSFPSGDATWVFDDSCELWSQRAWTDVNGTLHRDRTNCAAYINETNVVGDWENGTIYALDQDLYVDQVLGVDMPISWIRSFPHILLSMTPRGPDYANGKLLTFSKFIADMECGNGELDVNGNPAQVGLRWSDDRGKTFGNTVLQSAGAPGEWLTSPLWPGPLGVARDRIFELSYSFNGKAALNGGWVDAQVLDV